MGRPFKAGTRIGIRCRDCGHVQIVPKLFLDRAAKPRCDHCGGLALPCESDRGEDLREGRLLRRDKSDTYFITKKKTEEDIDTRLDRVLDAQFGRKELFTAEEKRRLGIQPALPKPGSV